MGMIHVTAKIIKIQSLFRKCLAMNRIDREIE